ncbi:MAG: YceI family protein, partial [Bacteroidota bacterium]|nr:YceI family protein [Bacteroidota bacterium]
SGKWEVGSGKWENKNYNSLNNFNKTKTRIMKISNKVILLSAGVLLVGLFSFKVIHAAWKVNHKDAKITWTMPNGKHDGTISGLDATVVFDPAELEKGIIKATVEVKSIDAKNPKLNGHLQTADFFDAEKHPVISFTSEKITKTDSGFVATGKLAMRDSVHTIDVPFTFVSGEKESTIKGTMDIFAGDYGVGKKSEKGNDRVLITIEVPMSKE